MTTIANPSPPKSNNMVQTINRWSFRLIWLLVFIPFALSFGALTDLAHENGMAYPWLFPLMVDLALIIFNLVALKSSLGGERDLYAWVLVGLATLISLGLNVAHAPAADLLAQFMAALPPLFIFGSFHAVVRSLEHDHAHETAVETIADLLVRIDRLRQQQKDLEQENGRLEAEQQQRASELSRLKIQLQDGRQAVDHELQAKQDELTAVEHELTKVRHELTQAQKNKPAKAKSEPTNDERLTLLSELLATDEGQALTQKGLAKRVGVSVSTLKRDLAKLGDGSKES